jgi:hypothetical protein
MAITRAQIVRQLRRKGGIMGSNGGSMLVTPTRDGSRPGYYGPDAGFGDDDYKDASAAFDAGSGSGGSDRDFERARQAIDNRAAEKARKEAEERERIAKEAAATFNKREIERKALERRKRMGAKLIKERIPGTQEYLDAEDNDTEAQLDLFINDPYREDKNKKTLPSLAGFAVNLFQEPLKAGAKKTREFFTGPTKGIFGIDHKGVLAAGKFNYKGSPLTESRFADMTLTEKNQAFDDYLSQRNSNQIDAYGNPIGDRGGDNYIPPVLAPAPSITDQEPEEQLTELQRMLRDRGDIARRFAADGGIMNEDIIGGEFDFESARQMYGLGKLVKKATRAVKKVASSPIGKAALLYAGTAGLGALGAGAARAGTGFGIFAPSNVLANLGASKALFTNKILGDAVGPNATRVGGLFSKFPGGGVGAAITAASVLPFLGIGTGDESEEEAQAILDQSGIDIAAIRNNPEQYLARRFRAEGGPAEGKEPVAKKVMPLLDMNGMEKDYRETGGFVPIGRMEKADDVPARLSKNEFVFTADAVRNAGDGDIDKGAEVMYNMMKHLEDGGDVSEESQGLEGARNMFQTSQRLEEVL